MVNLPKNKQLILFDGICNLCNRSVQYIIKHDKKDVFRFVAIQSKIGKQFINQFKMDTDTVDSILLYSQENGLKNKSTAVLLIAKKLRFPVNLWSVFLIIPFFIRNWVYNYVAKNRYKWYGKQKVCMVPTPELHAKFLT